MESFLTDALLQTVMLQDIWLAVREDAPAGGGAGTWDDPFYAANPNLTDAQNADLFDAIMNDPVKVPEGFTVRLGPGTFYTRGHSTSSTGAWSPRNYTRLLGSGMNATTLKLVGVSSGQSRVAIGINHTNSASPLEGFEASDFHIDCGFSSAVSNSSNMGIAVYGRHVLLSRIRVTNFGGNISGAFLSVISAGAGHSENCQVIECAVDTPAANAGTQSSVIFFSFAGSSDKPHRFCVVRNCVGRGSGEWDAAGISQYQHGICAGTGIGTIIETNEIANAASAVLDLSTADPTKDLVIRNNTFRNVGQGISFNRTSGAIGRIIVTDNQITVRRGLTNPAGIYLGGTGSSRYKVLVLRKNVVRDISPDALNPIIGLWIAGCDDLNVERNVINHASATNAVHYENCGAVKSFNNQTSAGQLLRAHDGARYKMELADEVQDVLLASGSSTWKL